MSTSSLKLMPDEDGISALAQRHDASLLVADEASWLSYNISVTTGRRVIHTCNGVSSYIVQHVHCTSARTGRIDL